ncbi:MAG: hypothetical protein KTR28_02825 [Micavibrio sp.]|nr:hypothetical protein [Micavibrio sp.]
MSSDTLCYRKAYARDKEAVNDEIIARRLDCKKLLYDDPFKDPSERR